MATQIIECHNINKYDYNVLSDPYPTQDWKGKRGLHRTLYIGSQPITKKLDPYVVRKLDENTYQVVKKKNDGDWIDRIYTNFTGGLEVEHPIVLEIYEK